MARLPEAGVPKPRQAKAWLRRDITSGTIDPTSREADDATFELHFSVEDLSTRWGMSKDFVRRLFLNEPGVAIFCNPRPGRRVYRTLRIPASVASRVYNRISIAS